MNFNNVVNTALADRIKYRDKWTIHRLDASLPEKYCRLWVYPVNNGIVESSIGFYSYFEYNGEVVREWN